MSTGKGIGHSQCWPCKTEELSMLRAQRCSCTVAQPRPLDWDVVQNLLLLPDAGPNDCRMIICRMTSRSCRALRPGLQRDLLVRTPYCCCHCCLLSPALLQILVAASSPAAGPSCRAEASACSLCSQGAAGILHCKQTWQIWKELHAWRHAD